MGSLVAHGPGDARNIWVWLDGMCCEMTPLEDTNRSASAMAEGLGQRFYFRRVRDQVGGSEWWLAYHVDWAFADHGIQPRAFPTQDAAVMYALMKGNTS